MSPDSDDSRRTHRRTVPVTERWNTDKPHRCPKCHSVAVAGDPPKSWRVYACCRCATRFTRWPRLAWLLPFHADSCDCDTVWIWEDDPDD